MQRFNFFFQKFPTLKYRSSFCRKFPASHHKWRGWDKMAVPRATWKKSIAFLCCYTEFMSFLDTQLLEIMGFSLREQKVRIKQKFHTNQSTRESWRLGWWLGCPCASQPPWELASAPEMPQPLRGAGVPVQAPPNRHGPWRAPAAVLGLSLQETSLLWLHNGAGNTRGNSSSSEGC